MNTSLNSWLACRLWLPALRSGTLPDVPTDIASLPRFADTGLARPRHRKPSRTCRAGAPPSCRTGCLKSTSSCACIPTPSNTPAWTLLVLGTAPADTTPFEVTAQALGMDLKVVQQPNELLALYEAQMVLMRPDQIVAWRGHATQQAQAVCAQVFDAGTGGGRYSACLTPRTPAHERTPAHPRQRRHRPAPRV